METLKAYLDYFGFFTTNNPETPETAASFDQEELDVQASANSMDFPLHELINSYSFARLKLEKEIPALLAKAPKINLNQADEDGRTALHCIINIIPGSFGSINPHVVDYLNLISLLLEKGVDLNKPDKAGNTVLHLAAMRGDQVITEGKGNYDVNLVDFLIKKGANLEAKNLDDNTPLHIAAAFGQWRGTEILINAGANKDAKNKDHNRPMHYAVMGQAPNHSERINHIKVVETLVAHNAEIDSENKADYTPLKIVICLRVEKIEMGQKTSQIAMQDILAQKSTFFMKKSIRPYAFLEGFKAPIFTTSFEHPILPWIIKPTGSDRLIQVLKKGDTSLKDWINPLKP